MDSFEYYGDAVKSPAQGDSVSGALKAASV